MNNSKNRESSSQDKKANKNGYKLKTNDEAWGAPTSQPIILIADKV